MQVDKWKRTLTFVVLDLALAATVLGVLQCGSVKPTPAASTDFCLQAQENLLRLQCMEDGRLLGGPTKRGLPFSKLCQNLVQQGIFTQQDAQCLAQIKDCSQVDKTCSWGQ